MRDEFIKISGKLPGPTSVILGGVHGDETCGVKALEKIIPGIKIDCGNVWFAYGNPAAISANRRFTDADLNRMFCEEAASPKDRASYEYRRAKIMKTYMEQAEALLDIHASFTPESKPFAICEDNARGTIEFMPVDIVVGGFDATEPGGTDYYMNKAGRIGICVECGYLGDPASDQRAEEAIFAFLKARGHLPNDLAARKQKTFCIYKLYKTKTPNFSLIKPFSDFEEVKAGQVIGTDGYEPITAPEDGIILFAKNRAAPGSEAFLLGRKSNNG